MFTRNFQILIFLTLNIVVLVSKGELLLPSYPIKHNPDYYSYPKYKFSYGVNDPNTGDHKSQEEYRNGDVVKGKYTVMEPDGTLRVVHYTADDHNGFNAIVEKHHGPSIHPQQEIILKKNIISHHLPHYNNYGYY